MIIVNEISQRIQQKAEELFMQYGLRSVSMDDIANNIGISKKTIYIYFKDKDALVEAVIGSVIYDNQACCDRDKDLSKDAIHEIFLAIEMVLEMFKTVNPSLLYEMQKYYPLAFSIFLKHKDDYLYSSIKQNIERGIKEGLYRDDLDIEIMARFRLECFMIPFNPDFQSKVKADLLRIEEETTLHFLYGLVSPKGYKIATKYQENRNKK